MIQGGKKIINPQEHQIKNALDFSPNPMLLLYTIFPTCAPVRQNKKKKNNVSQLVSYLQVVKLMRAANDTKSHATSAKRVMFSR